jgi:hypothetical protein
LLHYAEIGLPNYPGEFLLVILTMLPFRIYPILLAGLAGGTILAFLLRRRKKTPQELERERRELITAIGRITDGTVVDVRELSGNGGGESQFIVYQYDVAGVSYEASQDVTYLRPMINLHSCRLGVPTSVKYDPHNPSNSIVASESWLGLRRN